MLVFNAGDVVDVKKLEERVEALDERVEKLEEFLRKYDGFQVVPADSPEDAG